VKVLLNIDLYWVDDRKAVSGAGDKDGNPVDKLDSYTIVNLSAHYDITDYIQLYGRIDNLFDEEYEEAWSYATPGLSGYLGVKVRY
jgi:vitamin B12 transporter